MRPAFRNFGLILSWSLALALVLCGCGGGGGGSSVKHGTSQPVISGVTSNATVPTALTQYSQYTFTVAATEPTAGVTIVSYNWNFGDGTTISNGAVQEFHVYATVGTFTVTVTATDSNGLTSTAFTQQETVSAGASPFNFVISSPPATGLSISVPVNGVANYTFDLTITPASGSSYTLIASGITFLTNDTVAGDVIGTPQAGSNPNEWLIPVTFPAAAAASATPRVFVPTVKVTDTTGAFTSAAVTFPTVSITTTTLSSASAPSIVITQPTTATTQVYAMESPTLAFVLTDPIVNPVTYTINWGDGSSVTTATVSDSTLPAGTSVMVTHQYLVAGTCNVTIDAKDTRSVNQNATQQKVSFKVLANALPQTRITAPLGSGTLGFTASQISTYYYPSSLASSDQPVIQDTGNPYLIEVIPEGGSLIFTGTATPTTSGEGLQSTAWTFPYAVPSSASGVGSQQVTFAGVPNALVAYLVEYQATDVFNRLSTPAYIWVVVDGIHTENFTLNLLYRQLSDNGGTASLNPVTSSANGLNTALEIHQDGYSNSYTINSANQASVSVPVRSNVPFYALLPVIGSSDPNSYALRIPCQPTASGSANPTGIDPELEGLKSSTTSYTLANGSSSFSFQSSSAPWNPTLNVVTAQGFAQEGSSPVLKNLEGVVGLEPATPPSDQRWLELPSEPSITYPLSWSATEYNVALFSGVPVNQSYAEWPLFMLTVESDKLPTLVADSAAGLTSLSSTAPVPSALGFNLNYSTYSNIPDPSVDQTPQASLVAAVTGMEAYRVPANSTDPYDLTHGVANWNETNCITALNPTPLHDTSPEALTYFSNLLFPSAASGTPFAGGLNSLVIPYDLNDINRLPLQSTDVLSRPLLNNLPVFAYAEYLWSTVWVQPVVLNSTTLTTMDLEGNMADPTGGPAYKNPGTNPGISHTYWLLQSLPSAWPKLINTVVSPGTKTTPIEPDGSYFDLTASGAGTFTATSPVAIGTAAAPGSAPVAPSSNPSTTGVGHFYWAAFTPSYASAGGALITRTWLAKGTVSQEPPVAIDGGTNNFVGTDDSLDAASGWGFVPAQDTMLDKRLRNPDGSLAGSSTGGFRVTWFNATRSPDGHVVPPDFWVVQLAPSGGTPIHFMVPSNYPAQPNFPDKAVVTADTTQTLSGNILTDARWYIAPPTTVGGPDIYSAIWTAQAQVAPGYCWFDVPAELRVADPASITVFAVKSILRNQPVSSARPLNRPDWLDAIKTAVANMKVVPSDGADKSAYHKIPFNFPWDIVVANSEPTPTQATIAASN
ncbi:MAG: PKD domain-containing protein [Holophaga sp.]|nr:PKD domain-containing protein [Holophaga sp.]